MLSTHVRSTLSFSRPSLHSTQEITGLLSPTVEVKKQAYTYSNDYQAFAIIGLPKALFLTINMN